MIELVNNYVLIQIEEIKQESVLEIADQYKELPTHGKVLAIDPDIAFQIGSEIIFRTGLKNNFKFRGKDYLLCKFSDIVGIVP